MPSARSSAGRGGRPSCSPARSASPACRSRSASAAVPSWRAAWLSLELAQESSAAVRNLCSVVGAHLAEVQLCHLGLLSTCHSGPAHVLGYWAFSFMMLTSPR
eukprot:7726312-Pyramimonas_sp.AAC.1